MKLIDFKADPSIREIPAMSIDFMMRNTPHFFSESAVPPHDQKLLAETGMSSSYKINVGTKAQLPVEGVWREADLRETVWLTIWCLQFGLPLFKGALVRTATPYLLPCPCHYKTPDPIALLRLQGRQINFKAENPNVLGDEVQSFWLQSLSYEYNSPASN